MVQISTALSARDGIYDNEAMKVGQGEEASGWKQSGHVLVLVEEHIRRWVRRDGHAQSKRMAAS